MKVRFDPTMILFLVFGAGDLVNGLWMLASPGHWFYNLPAGVPDFGPLNEHLVRDLGSMFTLFGCSLLAAAFRPGIRIFVIYVNLGWYALHCLVHIYDTLRGLVAREHFLIDMPLVYVPTVFLALILWVLKRRHAASREIG